MLTQNSCSPKRGLSLCQPAARWQDALPLGNGTLGALVFGHIAREVIVWNHEALWLCNPPPPAPTLAPILPALRELLRREQWREANQLWREASAPFRASIDPYQPALSLEWDQETEGAHTFYRRTLDFASGEASVRWRDAGGDWERSALVSRADDVGLVHLQGPGESGRASARLRLPTHDSVRSSSMGSGRSRQAEVAGLTSHSRAEVRGGGEGWIEWESQRAHDGAYCECCAVARVIAPGGTLRVEGEWLVVEGATSITLLLDVAANQQLASASARLREHLAALPPNFAALRARHRALHGELFERATLDLAAPARRETEVEALQHAGADGQVPAVWLEKLHDLGRYLLIGASRPGDFPRSGWAAHLQGLWNGDFAPMWSSDYHNDINVQMNYWAALPGALPETTLPFFDYYEHFLEDYRANARALFGCRGIVAPIAQSTHGVASAEWAAWTAGAGWLAQLFWDYWLFSGDRVFLGERALPVLREVARFYEDFCTWDEAGHAHFSPSISPENVPATQGAGRITVNATMDVAVAREVLSNLLEACRELGVQPESPRWKELLDALPPYQIAPDGQLREWLHPALPDNPRHRHASQLYGLFPGFGLQNWPELREAARRSLEARLQAGQTEQTGWSLAQTACLWARLGAGDRALEALELLARTCIGPNGFAFHNDWRGQGASLFWGHNNPPPFQIEANFGLTAAIGEMLLQSRADAIQLLPALPTKWPEGQLRGWQTRCGVGVDLQWSEGGRVWKAELRASRATQFTLVAPPASAASSQIVTFAAGQNISIAEGVVARGSAALAE